MTQETFQKIVRGDIELVIETSSGECFMSQNSLARLCGVHSSTINKHFNRHKLSCSVDSREAQILTTTGLKTVALYNEDYILMAIARYKPGLIPKLSGAGLRLFLHGLVGISYEAKLNPTANQPTAKPKALEAAEYTKQIMDLLATDNPRLAQYLVDHCLNEVIGSQLPQSSQNSLSPSYYVPPYLGVVELAEKLGYPVDISSRSLLGKFVKARVGHLAKQEKRLCNGRMTDIYVYPECDTVCEAVVDFFK